MTLQHGFSAIRNLVLKLRASGQLHAKPPVYVLASRRVSPVDWLSDLSQVRRYNLMCALYARC
jgi:hypothetical protein